MLSRDDEICAIRKPGSLSCSLSHERLQIHCYELNRANTKNIYPLVLETESKAIRGAAAAEVAFQLDRNGFVPDLIVGHPGWGDLLFLSDLWPKVPQLHYLEFFHGVPGTDSDIEDRFSTEVSEHERQRVRMKNANLLMNLEQMDWGLTPTRFQKSVLPYWAQQQTSVIHDGIDTHWLKPDRSASLRLPNELTLRAGDPVVTFINRTFEPYRGIHIFLEALARLQHSHATAQAVLVGLDTPNVSYGASRKDGLGWLSALKYEMGDQLDWDRIHCLGTIPHQTLRKVYQISAAHVYLTYPFVLSWSLLEAMSCQCLIVGSATAPVQEIVNDRVNGLLVPFQDSYELANTLLDALTKPGQMESFRSEARLTALNYDINDCVKKQMRLLDFVRDSRLT